MRGRWAADWCWACPPWCVEPEDVSLTRAKIELKTRRARPSTGIGYVKVRGFMRPRCRRSKRL